MIPYIYAHLASLRFEPSVCRGSFMTTYITLLAWLVMCSLVYWYQQCVTVHHVFKCMNRHKVILVMYRDSIELYIESSSELLDTVEVN